MFNSQPKQFRPQQSILSAEDLRMVAAGWRSSAFAFLGGKIFHQMDVSINGDTPKWMVYGGKIPSK